MHDCLYVYGELNSQSMKIKKHLLYHDNGKQVSFVDTPNKSGKIKPKYLLMHYTATTSAKSTINWFQKPEAQVSAHLLIDRDGSITQFAPFNVRTWHAGRSSWGALVGLNAHSIGVELVNAGKLMKNDNVWYSPLDRKKIPASQVLYAIHKNEQHAEGWQDYTEAQLEAAMEVGALLVNEYALKDVLGHDDVSPFRKTDPGTAFPMPGFRSRIMGRNDDKRDIFKTTVKLNIREGAGTFFEKVAKPLPPGTELQVLDVDGNWSFVSVLEPVHGIMDLEGWVYSKYLEQL